MFEFECPNCSTVLHIPEQYIGSKGRCKKCKASIVPSRETTKPDSSSAESLRAYGDCTAPNLIVLHAETTGPSSRKCNIIELGCLKIDLAGNELDNYWTFCNPDHHIPEKIQARTGISEDMLAQAPYSFEVSKEFFEWAGSDPIFIVDHAHFHAKFLSAPLLREDVEPPCVRVVDVSEWAEHLKLPLPDFKLRTLMHHVGHTMEHGQHRALDTTNALQHIVVCLLENQSAKLHGPGQKTLLGKMLNKDKGEHGKALYDSLIAESKLLGEACGEDFYIRQAYDARKAGVPVQTIINRNGGEAPAFVMHMPEWFEEKRHMIKRYRSQPRTDTDPLVDHSGDAQWEFALFEASQSETAEEKRRYLMRAVDLGATDPKPYETMIGFYIREKNYQSARDICERYFESDNWKQPQHAGTSLKMLERLQKLEMKLAKHA